MKKIGGYFMVFGLLAIILNFMDRVPRLLVWIYSWGDTVGWIIKVGLIAIGAALYLFGMKQESVIEPLEQTNNTD